MHREVLYVTRSNFKSVNSNEVSKGVRPDAGKCCHCCEMKSFVVNGSYEVDHIYHKKYLIVDLG